MQEKICRQLLVDILTAWHLSANELTWLDMNNDKWIPDHFNFLCHLDLQSSITTLHWFWFCSVSLWPCSVPLWLYGVLLWLCRVPLWPYGVSWLLCSIPLWMGNVPLWLCSVSLRLCSVTLWLHGFNMAVQCFMMTMQFFIMTLRSFIITLLFKITTVKFIIIFSVTLLLSVCNDDIAVFRFYLAIRNYYFEV